jgi:hypothetical protein
VTYDPPNIAEIEGNDCSLHTQLLAVSVQDCCHKGLFSDSRRQGVILFIAAFSPIGFVPVSFTMAGHAQEKDRLVTIGSASEDETRLRTSQSPSAAKPKTFSNLRAAVAEALS